MVKNPPANAEDGGDVGLMIPGEDPLEKEMSTHSSILAGKSHAQRDLAGRKVRHNLVNEHALKQNGLP